MEDGTPGIGVRSKGKGTPREKGNGGGDSEER